MSNTSSTAQSVGTTARRLVSLAIGVTLLSTLLAIAVIGMLTTARLTEAFLPTSYELLQLRAGMVVTAIYLYPVAVLLTVVSALLLLLLRPVRSMRCWFEASVLVTLAMAGMLLLISRYFMEISFPLQLAGLFIVIILQQLSLLLLYRKLALLLKNTAVAAKAYALFRLLVISVVLVEAGLTVSAFAAALSENVLATTLFELTIFIAAGVTLVLYIVRLFSLSLSVRNELCTNSALHPASLSIHESEASNQPVTSEQNAVPVVGLMRFQLWAMLLLITLCAGEFAKQSVDAVELQKVIAQDDAYRVRRTAINQATVDMTEVWNRVQFASGMATREEIAKLQTYCSKFPSATSYCTLGMAHYRSNEFEAALSNLKQCEAITLYTLSGEPFTVAFMAMSYRKLKVSEKAEEYRTRFEQLMEQSVHSKTEALQIVQQEVKTLFDLPLK